MQSSALLQTLLALHSLLYLNDGGRDLGLTFNIPVYRYMIARTVDSKHNLLVHPLSTSSIIQRKDAMIRVDSCNVHMDLN